VKFTSPLFISAFGAWALIATGVACAADHSAPVLSKDEASYLLGVNYGVVMRNYDIGMEITPDAVNRGFKDGLAGKKASAADQQRLKEFIAMVQPVASQLHAAAAREFLSHNMHEKDVKTTASGLQYKILAAGDERAAAAKPEDLVSVHYRGTLLDGTEFDSTYGRGSPLSFPVNGVIKGWQEALLLMKPGAKWQVFIPPDLGYGKAPRPGIPGGSLLIFDVELLKVIPADTSNAAQPGG
jgi:FKBP-type peptidyl-prolyl cis-trans isomerase